MLESVNAVVQKDETADTENTLMQLSKKTKQRTPKTR